MALPLAFIFSTCSGAYADYALRVVNPTASELTQSPIVFKLDRLPQRYRTSPLSLVTPSGESVPSQVDDLDRDGKADELVFLADLPAEATRKLLLKQRRPNRFFSDLQIPDNFSVFKNSFLRGQAITTDTLGVRVQDRTTEQYLLDRLFLSSNLAGIEKHDKNTRVLARGPLRAIVEQTFLSDDKDARYRVKQRYVMYRADPGFTLHLIFKNITDGPQSLRLYNENPLTRTGRDIIKGMEGPLLRNHIRQSKMIGVDTFRDSRPNVLHTNPETGYGMGYLFHSPRWRYFNRALWTSAAPNFQGVRDLKWLRTYPRLFWGRLMERPFDNLFRKRSFWKSTAFEVGPGQSKHLGISLRFYRPDTKNVRDRFRLDRREALGAAHVFGLKDGRVLSAASVPLSLEETFKTGGRWVSDPKAQIQVRDGNAQITAQRPGHGIRTALTRDWIDPTRLRGQLTEISEGTVVRFTLQRLDQKRQYPLLEITKPQAFNVDLRELLPFAGLRPCRLDVTLHTKGDSSSPNRLRAILEEMAISWPIPGKPQLQSPDNGAVLTQFSVQVLSGTPEMCERGFQVQVARNNGFSETVLDRKFANPIRMTTGHDKVERSLTPVDTELPEGDYFFRVRAIGISHNPSRWTQARAFRVRREQEPAEESEDDAESDRPTRPLVREISPDRPLFLIPHAGREAFWEALPDSVRPMFAERHKLPHRYDKAPKHPVLLSLSHTGSGLPPYSRLEQLFKMSDNFLGFWYAEGTYDPEVGVQNLKFAAKHGRYTGKLGGSFSGVRHGAHKRFYKSLKDYGRYFLPAFKSQNPQAPLDGQINLIGLYLSGRTGVWGTETERFTPLWPGILSGYRVGKPTPDRLRHTRTRLQQRPIDWMPTFLVGLAYGACSYRVEGAVGAKKNPSKARIWITHTENERFGPLWKRAIGPFFKDIVEHDLIPSRKEVQNQVRGAIQLQPDETTPETYPFELTTAVHGTPTHWYQWVPNTPRYGIVPVLSPYATKADRTPFEKVIQSTDYQYPYQAQKALNKIYPPVKSSAFCVRSGDTGVITHSGEMYRDVPLPIKTRQKYFGKMPTKVIPREYPVRATPQYYRMRLTNGPIASIEGEVGFRQYLILKQRPRRLFVHCNNYKEFPTRLVLNPKNEVAIRVVPEEARVSIEQADDQIALRLRHDHPRGVVRIFVERKQHR